MTLALRCPRCADPMVEVAGEVTCLRSDMPLSGKVREYLEQYVRMPPSRPDTAKVR